MPLSIARTKEDCCSNDKLRAALFYIQQGWALIPLEPMGKRPFKPLLPVIKGVSKWEPLAHRPATEEEVKSWFDKYPDINIGIITGQASGLVVIDYDAKPKGLPTITPTVETGRGYHLYLSTEEEVASRKLPKIDIQAEGKYVVAPPSIHPDGKPYTWAEMLSPAEIDTDHFSFDLLDIDKDTGEGVVSINIYSCYTPETPYIDYQKHDEVAFAVINKFGRNIKRVGKAFRCVLPGHEETKPSAALYRMDNGIIALKDFHKAGDTWLLPDVYASCLTGKEMKLKPGERIIWWLRALSDLGIISPPIRLHSQLPENVSESVRRLYKGFVQLVALREMYKPAQEGTPFSWEFARRWCGIGSNTTVQKSMAWLLKNGYIRMVREGSKIGQGSKSAIFELSVKK